LIATPSTRRFIGLRRRPRREDGLSQEDLAERAGLSARSISDRERGVNRTPGARFCCGWPMHWLWPDRHAPASRRRHGGTSSAFAPMRPARLTTPGAANATERLVGRDEETRALIALLQRAPIRLVTLTGPSGVGKRRLALAEAAELSPDFPDGVIFVSLASLGDAGLVLSVLAQSTELRARGSRSPADALAAHLQAKRLLLVLDHFEHLLPAASAVATMLEACPQLTVMATSRAGLHLRGEHEVSAEPLALPDTLATYPAVALFVERVQEHRRQFILDMGNAFTVAEVCTRLDGLPLALELAAAQSRLFSPRAWLALLDRRLVVLSDGPRDLPSCQ
jgi:hypothetical protein